MSSRSAWAPEAIDPLDATGVIDLRDSVDPAGVIDLRDPIDRHAPETLVEQSIVVPAFNEESRLPLSMTAFADHLDPRVTEIIVVDDGSTDATAEVADELLRVWPHGRRISLDRNRGKGRAVRTGVLATTGKLVAYVDADSATDVRCLQDLFQALETADVAIGSRSLPESIIEHHRQDRALMGQAFNYLARSATGLPWRDTQCGFKAFRAPVAKLLFAFGTVDGFAFDVEVLDLANRLGLRAAEVPVRWQHVDGSKVRRVRDSLEMTYDVVRAARSDHRTPVECLHLGVPSDHSLVEVLRRLPDAVMVSVDRGTVEIVVPPGEAHAGAVTSAHLQDRRIHVEPLVRSGTEIIERCRHGSLTVGFPGEPPPEAPAATPRNGVVDLGRTVTRRALRRGTFAMGHSPATLPVLLRLTPLGTSRRIDQRTDLVIEGFPRSGNTFAATAVQQATRNGIRVVSHVHHPSQVKLAVRRRVPTVLLIRRPLPALASYLTAGPHARPGRVLEEYIGYHRELLPYLDDVEVVDFDEATTDLQPVFQRLNTRFGLGIPEFEHDERSVSRIFATIGERHLAVHAESNPEPTVPRPSSWRLDVNAANQASLEHPSLAPLLCEAEHLHRLFVDSRRR
jgi:dolichyl-phosphate beta-glucosyltransferase